MVSAAHDEVAFGSHPSFRDCSRWSLALQNLISEEIKTLNINLLVLRVTSAVQILPDALYQFHV